MGCLGRLQVTERAIADPLLYAIICTYKVYMSYDNAGENFTQEGIAICMDLFVVLFKGKLICILLPFGMES